MEPVPVLRHAGRSSTLSVSHPTICCHHGHGGESGRSEVHFACAQEGESLDSVKMLALGNPELGEISATELFPEDIRSVRGVRIQDAEALPSLFIWDGSDHTGRRTEELVERFLYPAVRHHLTTNFAETRQAVSDMDKPIGVDHADITRDVPAVPQYFRRLLGLS